MKFSITFIRLLFVGLCPAITFGCTDVLTQVEHDDRLPIADAAANLQKELETVGELIVRASMEGTLVVYTQTVERKWVILTRYWQSGYQGYPVSAVLSSKRPDPAEPVPLLDDVPGHLGALDPPPPELRDDIMKQFYTQHGLEILYAGGQVSNEHLRHQIPAEKIGFHLSAAFASDAHKSGWSATREILLSVERKAWPELETRWKETSDIFIIRVIEQDFGTTPQTLVLCTLETPQTLISLLRESAVVAASLPPP